MAKQEWEENAKNRFLHFLGSSRGEKWIVLNEDVVVDATTNRNFDYQLGSGERRIALELVRLVNNEEELARERVWSEVVHSLGRELSHRVIKGYLLTTRPYFSVPKVKREAFVKELADRVQRVIESNPNQDELNFDGFSLKRIEGLDGVVFSSFGKGGAINSAGIALAALEEKLPNKNDQLSIGGHERIILVVNWAYIVATDDFVEAATQINFGRFPNIDKIFFEVSPDNFQLVFDRSLFSVFGGSSKRHSR